MGKFVFLLFVALFPSNVILDLSAVDYENYDEGDTTLYPVIESGTDSNVTNVIFETAESLPGIDEVNDLNYNGECGVMSSSSGLIQKGNFSKLTDFPWMATIVDYKHANGKNSSGALISTKHVLTRGAIFPHWSKYRIVWNLKHTFYWNWNDLKNIKIYLGSLEHTTNENVYDIDHVHLQPDRKVTNKIPINNLALIRLKNSVDFNEIIRPVCLWNVVNDDDFYKNLPIYAVGYGKDENGVVSNVRKHTKVNYVNQTYCMDKHFDIPKVFKRIKTFCIVGTEEGSPCNFDETLFIKYNGKWYLKGIISRFFVDDNREKCLYNTPYIYEDITQHLAWIVNKRNEDLKLKSSQVNF